MARRVTRAKVKIRDAGIPFRVPSSGDLPERVSGVLAVLFLIFNEGYLATGVGTDPVRGDLAAEAIRLARLIRNLMPQDGEVAGLPAMMLLIDARRPARVSVTGELVTIDEQDRGAWNRSLIALDPSPIVALNRGIAIAESADAGAPSRITVGATEPVAADARCATRCWRALGAVALRTC
jgi:predicted RNA polymerase sigma factor